VFKCGLTKVTNQGTVRVLKSYFLLLVSRKIYSKKTSEFSGHGHVLPSDSHREGRRRQLRAQVVRERKVLVFRKQKPHGGQEKRASGRISRTRVSYNDYIMRVCVCVCVKYARTV